MPNPVFMKHLENTLPLSSYDTSTSMSEDNDAISVKDILEAFANILDLDDPDLDLCDAWDVFVEEVGVEEDAEYLSQILCEVAKRYGGSDDDASIKSFLRQLSKFPKTDTSSTVADQRGYQPHPSETGAIATLRQHTIAKHQAFDNPGFDASHYKQFDRSKHHYGHDNVNVNAMNAVGQLANPRLNVTSEGVFRVVDTVGMSSPTGLHYAVLNTATGDVVTNLLHREAAMTVCNDLNVEMKTLLGENGLLIVGDTVVDANKLPSQAIEENLLKPLNPRYLEAFQNKENWTASGNQAQSDRYKQGPAADQKAALLLQERNRRDDEPSEQDALNVRSTGRGRK